MQAKLKAGEIDICIGATSENQPTNQSVTESRNLSSTDG